MAESEAGAAPEAAAATAPATTTQADTGIAPVINRDQTTAVGENTEAQQQVLEGEIVDEQPPQRGFDMTNLLFWVVAALWIWYFFGSKKRRQARANEKKERERRSTLEKGDNVVTIGRMHGTVVAFTDATVTLKPDTKADYTMTFDRNAIYRVLPRPGEEVEDGQTG